MRTNVQPKTGSDLGGFCDVLELTSRGLQFRSKR
uniref:Uncharacterized protein n=1 Tax=Anguilla anguilla TaxID=7936 RepID=A0A0E9S9T1_ANGAN